MSLGLLLRRWLARHVRNPAMIRRSVRWLTCALPLPYLFRFRLARWTNLLTLDSGVDPEVQVVHDGLHLTLDLRDHLQWVTYYLSTHEPHVLMTLCALLRPEQSFVDLGAHIGLYALYAGQFYRRQGLNALRVLAVEPNPALFERLQQHIAVNTLSTIVQAVGCAVGDHDGVTSLYLSGWPNAANSALRDLRGDHPHTQDGRVIPVRLARLDSLIAVSGLLRPVGVLKADIEGAELEAFRGATALLAEDHPFVIFEAHSVWMRRFGYTLSEMLRFWDAQHYTCFAIGQDNVLRPLRPSDAEQHLHAVMDCLAVHEAQIPTLASKLRIQR